MKEKPFKIFTAKILAHVSFLFVPLDSKFDLFFLMTFFYDILLQFKRYE